jgi:hypothetical protein
VFRVVRLPSDIIFDENRNAHAACLRRDQTDIFELPEETDNVGEIDSGRDGLPYDRTGMSRTGEHYRSGDHDWTDDDTDHNLPNIRQTLLVCTGMRSRPSEEKDAPLVSTETVVHN